MVLIDNGSALNVCPLKVASCLGLGTSDFTPSDQVVKAYDNTRREVLGVVTLEVLIGPVRISTSFQVIDVATSFNLLLGRPWLHANKAVPSSLHPKLKFPYEGTVITVRGDTYGKLKPTIDKSLLEVRPETSTLLSGFHFDTIQCIEGERTSSVVGYDFEGCYINCLVGLMMKMPFLPGSPTKSGKSPWTVQADRKSV